MPVSTPTPHDALFKAVFGQPEHARGALRAVLPVAIAEALDWATLAACPGSFIDPRLNGQHTDLLFSVSWRAGGDALVYVLFEHQSAPDDWMAFRLLRYLLRIWERWRTEQAGPGTRKTLPVVLPVVLYHGAEPWSVALHDRSGVDGPWQRAVRTATLAAEARGAERVRDLGRRMPDEQRGLEAERQALDQ